LHLNLDPVATGVPAKDLLPGCTYFGRLQIIEEGFSHIVEVLENPPVGDYVAVRKGAWTGLDFSFDRYYLKESVAPRVDEIFMHDLRDGRIEATLVIRVRHGTSTIEELLLDGQPLGEHVRKQPLRPREAGPTSPGD
jgi:hypothetical protein